MSQPWTAELPSAIPLRDFVTAATSAGVDAAVCVFAPDDTVEGHDRRGYAALVIAYSRFEEPVAILEDGCTALLIRDGGLGAAAAAARRILAQAGRMGLNAHLRAGLALVGARPEQALRTARSAAVDSAPGAVAGAA